MSERTHLRGAVLSFTAKPDSENHPAVHYLEDGVVTLADGLIHGVQSVAQFQKHGGKLQAAEDLRPGLLVPGFVDTHIHYPQMDIVASYGARLLDWLDRHAYPAEQRFADRAHAVQQAELFMQRLFQAGTTTAMTFTTVHPHATDALFTAAAAVNSRMIAGKVLMNRNAPADLLDKTDGNRENRLLLERWHGQGRLAYAISPRFAITSDEGQLAAAGRLLQRHPGVYLHSHISEHPDEVAATLKLFPHAEHYVDVYARHGLVTDHSLFAHGIHLRDEELMRLHEGGAGIAFCPSSNLFLGSGLLSLQRLEAYGVTMGVGSDVGGGTRMSMLSTAAEGYKVAQLNGENWHPLAAMYAITRGGAAALNLEHKIGTLAPGFEADLTVLDAGPGSAAERRAATPSSLTDRLFKLLFLNPEGAVSRTYVAGELRYQRAIAA